MMELIKPLKSLVGQARREVRSQLLRGDRVYCPLCDRHYKHFLPAGIIPRPNVYCANCGSMERHRLLWLALQSLWQNGTIARVGKMLHVAPEPTLARHFQRDYDYLSVDLDGANAMQAMDICAIAFPDNTFDAIVCNHVLEHVPADQQALAELYRVLKPGGWASIQVPLSGDVTQEDLTITDPQERERRYGQSDHVRQYGRDFGDRLKAAGFALTILPKESLADAELLEKLSVECESEVWICRKPG